MTEGVAAANRASEVVCEGDRGWHLRLEDIDPYAKAPKIKFRDFKRERRTSSPNETLNQWQRLAIETSEAREACLQQMRLKL